MHKGLIGLVAVALLSTVGGPAQAEPAPEARCSIDSVVDYVTAAVTVTVDRNQGISSPVCPPEGTPIDYAGVQYTLTFDGSLGKVRIPLVDGERTVTYGFLRSPVPFQRLGSQIEDWQPRGTVDGTVTGRYSLNWGPSLNELSATARLVVRTASGAELSTESQVVSADSGLLALTGFSPGPAEATLIIEDALGVLATKTKAVTVPGPPPAPRAVKGEISNQYLVRCNARISDNPGYIPPPQPGFIESKVTVAWQVVPREVSLRINVQLKGPGIKGTHRAFRRSGWAKTFRKGPLDGRYKARVQVSTKYGKSPWTKWKKLPTKTKKRCL